jgi:hypothetical protein
MENRLPLRNKTTLCVQSSFFVPDRLGTLVLGILFSTLSFFPTPTHSWLPTHSLIAPLTRVKLLFYVCNAGGKPAYPFCGTCYDDSPLLYPYSRGKTCINSFPANVIQENAPSIDFDQSR